MRRRYVLTGASGSGKTSLLCDLRRRGYAVVEEAATDIIAAQQAHGIDEPWLRNDFVDLIVLLQREQLSAPATGRSPLQLHDRSPLCTLALARYLARPVTPLLAAEVTRVLREQLYEPTALLIRPLGFIEPTAARRISYADSLAFEQVHVEVYRDHGFALVDIPPGPLTDRTDAAEAHLLAAAGRQRGR